MDEDILNNALGETKQLCNTEVTDNCWHLLLPPSKNFEKTLSLPLNPGEQTEVGVVVKSPQISRSQKFYSVLELTLQEGKADDSIKVFSVANIVTPKLECTKQLVCLENGLSVIPLVAKFEDSQQDRVKIPFRNNGAKELEMVLTVVPYPNSNKEQPKLNVACTPSTCKIAPNSMGLVNLTVGLADNITNSKANERQQMVLVIKIKNSLLLYYFVLDFSLIFNCKLY
eukprot:TRINITY_DN12952_c0_g1_i6.p1 TRINITY_DN12952_c0_g1~~TRINITY_DN12952_c0_g1_i6.p1  ORF type:complete len:227 (-),score=32.87 TRINITY_DN12952_c0_g1_i6:138-818(-)